MIGLDTNRNIIHDMGYVENSLSEDDFLIIDDTDIPLYHFEPYSSDKLIYLAELDLVYSIFDLDKGLLLRAPCKVDDTHVRNWIVRSIDYTIPQLKKLLKNKHITKTNASKKIKERDNNCCQLCGENDARTLNVHHIVPRTSPFFSKDFINSPINQITLCANCHRIEHYILANSNANKRKEHVKRLFELNGFNWNDRLTDAYYAPMEDIKKYK